MEKDNDKAPYTALDVARWYVDRANKEEIDDGVGEGITNLKLQKIVYLAQAAYLGTRHEPLFDDEIQAWQYGPVIPVVYEHYKHNGSQPIIEKEVVTQIDADTQEFLESVWQLFGGYSASRLVEFTHEHLPWQETYKPGFKNTISPELMEKYYQNVFTLTNSDYDEKQAT